MSQEQDIKQDQATEDPSEAGTDAGQGELAADDVQQEITLRSVVEAILFASDEPLEASKVAKVAGAGSARQVRQLVDELNAEYAQRGSAYHIEQIAGGYVMLTLPEYNDWLKQLLRTRQESKLSQAALETLAIVSYKQPVMRVTVEAIRGVAAGEMIRNLMEKGLVKIVGRAQELGRPLLYGTTRKFLEIFGLNSLQDLPKVAELRPKTESTPKEEPPANEIAAVEHDNSSDVGQEDQPAQSVTDDDAAGAVEQENQLQDSPEVADSQPETESAPIEDQPIEEIVVAEDNPSDTAEEKPPEESS